MADFLCLDDDLLAVAAEASPLRGNATADPKRLAAWVTKLPTVEKDQLLVRIAQHDAATVHMELLRRFRDNTTPAAGDQPRRTVTELLDGAAWARVHAIATRTPGEYDNAVRLLTDLQALAERDDRPHEFAQRCAVIRQDHARETTLIGRLDSVNL